MKQLYKMCVFGLLAYACLTVGAFAQSSHYVTLHGRQFKLEGQDFYPVSMNYIVDIVEDGQGNRYPAPHRSYFASNQYECYNEQECYDEIVEDMATLKNLGFNSVRVVGLGFGAVKDASGQVLDYPSLLIGNSNNYIPTILPIGNDYSILFHCIQRTLDAAAQSDIKVQLLVGGAKIDVESFRAPFLTYLEAVAAHFNNNSTLYSYDFFNEPAYNDNANYSKQDVCGLVDSWHQAIKGNSEYQLTTIGLANSSDVFEWDPGILKLDFLSFHIYQITADIDVLKSELKWISEMSPLPWIIGETGFAASSSGSGGQGTLQEQRDFVKTTLELTRDCGGSGYSWWDYQDVHWGLPEDHMGLLDHQNIVKPAGMEFGLFDPGIQGGTCVTPPNYYNLEGFSNASISGKVVDDNGSPVGNAVIVCSDGSYGNVAKTFSKSDGTFTLFSNGPIEILKASAVGTQVVAVYDVSGFQNIVLNLAPFLKDIQYSDKTIHTSEVDIQKATNSINVSDVTVQSGGHCELVATQIVRINTDFKANRGSYFHAYNQSLYQDCGDFKKGETADFMPKPIPFRRDVRYYYSAANDDLVANEVSIYPNPSTGVFQVKASDHAIDQVEVFNSVGQKVYEIVGNSNVLQVDLSSGYPNAIYVLKTYIGEQVLISRVTLNR